MSGLPGAAVFLVLWFGLGAAFSDSWDLDLELIEAFAVAGGGFAAGALLGIWWNLRDLPSGVLGEGDNSR